MSNTDTNPSVLLDVAKRALLVRSGGQSEFAPYPIEAVVRMEILEQPTRILFGLSDGVRVELGPLESQELAMRIARAIAVITRCPIEVDPAETQPLRARPQPVSLQPFLEVEPTIPVSYIEAELIDPDEDDTEIELLDEDDEETLYRPATRAESRVSSGLSPFRDLAEEPTPRLLRPPPVETWAGVDVRITPRPSSFHRRPKPLDPSRWRASPMIMKRTK